MDILKKTDFTTWAWQWPDMLGCSTVCPKCKHEFACCPQGSVLPGSSSLQCPGTRRSLVLSGGGLVGASVGANLVPSPSPCPSPQASLISPSTPLSFVLPLPLQSVPPPQEAKPEAELQQLADTVLALRQSGWYYEGMTYQESHDLLKDTKVGTFLVRNSSNPRFLFSLSVQTERGPTSVRLHYTNGYFRLDAQAHLQGVMPAFPNVVDLVEHYIQEFKKYSRNTNMQVWVDNQGKWYSSIRIETPLKKREEPPSLKHLSRLAIHRAIQSSGQPRITRLPPLYKQLELPNSLIKYLGEYPHPI